jgi:small subunit ribosomal protein S8e
MLWQGKSVRTETGGRLHLSRKKRRVEIGRAPAETVIGEVRNKKIRTFGGNQKIRSLRANVANVADPKTGVTKKTEIQTVEENTANPNYVRRNLLTKGAVIRTGLGRAKVVSRPGQDGVVNAVLIE